MDKVAFYEEVILGNIFEDETENVEKTAEEEFVDAVADRVIEKIAATKFKEVLQTGMLPGGAKASGKTKKILSFNMNDQSGNNRFQKPGVNLGGRTISGPSFDSPTRNIRAAKKFKDHKLNYALDDRQSKLGNALVGNAKKQGLSLFSANGATKAQYN